MSKRRILSILFWFFLYSCSTGKITEGEGFLDVRGGKIWYRVIGTGTKTPIVMLHGGPGFPSYSLEPLFELAQDRQIIVYDQLGCGRSSALTDTALMNIESQLEDLKALLQKLDIQEFYLYGHSYGTMLAVDYYCKNERLPQALLLASPCMSTQAWEQDADTLISSMDTSYSRPLMNYKKGNYSDTSHYYKAIDKYYSSFYNKKTSRLIDSSIAKSGKDLYLHMWGREDFVCSGNLKLYNRTGDLQKIKVPVLYTTGEFDAARPSTVQYYQSLTPNSKLVAIKNAGHSTMIDDPEANLLAIREFLIAIEKNN